MKIYLKEFTEDIIYLLWKEFFCKELFKILKKKMNYATEETPLLPPGSSTVVIDPPPSYEAYVASTNTRLYCPQFEVPGSFQQQPAVLQQPTGRTRCTQSANPFLTELQDPAQVTTTLSQPVSHQCQVCEK